MIYKPKKLTSTETWPRWTSCF